MRCILLICGILGLLLQVGQAQLTVDDTKDAAARQKKTDPKAVREGVGWGTFKLGATTDDLVDLYGEPQQIDGQEWSWADTRHFSCLINDNLVAYQLNFFDEFAFPLTSDIRIGSPALKSLGKYGVPENVAEHDGFKYFYYPKKGLIVKVMKKSVVGFSVIDKQLTDTNPIIPVFKPGEIPVVTNEVPEEAIGVTNEPASEQ